MCCSNPVTAPQSRVCPVFAHVAPIWISNWLMQVQNALRKAGLESSNLIVAVDFTVSNTSQGLRSFGGRSLHDLGPHPNPYEQVHSSCLGGLQPQSRSMACLGSVTASQCDAVHRNQLNNPEPGPRWGRKSAVLFLASANRQSLWLPDHTRSRTPQRA